MGNPFFDFKKKDERENPGLYKDKSVVEKAKLAGKRYRAQKGKKSKGGSSLSPSTYGGSAELSSVYGGSAELSSVYGSVSGGKSRRRRASRKNKSKKNKSKKNKSRKNKSRKSRR